MLHKDAKRRITVLEMFYHPWLDELDPVSERFKDEKKLKEPPCEAAIEILEVLGFKRAYIEQSIRER